MKVRKKKAPPALRVDVVKLLEPGRLITLEVPDDAELDARTRARGAFVRLRPPPGTTPEEIEAWRSRIAAVALAVKVLPAPQAADVPAASTRVDVEDRVGSVREEALRLAEETGREPVIALVRAIVDEVGA